MAPSLARWFRVVEENRQNKPWRARQQEALSHGFFFSYPSDGLCCEGVSQISLFLLSLSLVMVFLAVIEYTLEQKYLINTEKIGQTMVTA